MRGLLKNAIRDNREHLVQYYIDLQTDKNMVDNWGRTPLQDASRYPDDHLGVVKCLVVAGVSINKVEVSDSDDYGESLSPLCLAARNGNFKIARYLLEQGADREQADKFGKTPLHWAANHGYLEIAKLLMSYGADLNARNNFDYLPIDVTSNEKIKQAIRDEPRRRMDHGHKRATEEERHLDAATSASSQQEDEGEAQVQSNKRPRLNKEEAEEGKVAEEDEDSEPTSSEGES